MNYERIRVYITPLIYEDIYGDEENVTSNIDVSAFVHENFGKIKREVDSGDYDFGVFVFGSINLKCFNDEGLFSTPDDYRSIFKWKRDLAKVKIVYLDADNNESVLFNGLLNEDTTREEDMPDSDIDDNTIKFRILSMDSVFRHVEVTGGAVAAGIYVSTAIKTILNTTKIKTVLNYDAANINVNTDIQIDNGEFFSGLSTKDALDELLLVSNSILYIDKDFNIHVKPRIESPNTYNLYGHTDPLGRGNILSIKSFNTGIQRTFTAIKVNDTEVQDAATVEEYGYRLKTIDTDIIDDPEKEEIIALNILDEFKVPRFECKVKVPATDVAGIELFDQVQIYYPLRYLPPEGEEFVTTVNSFKLGTSKPSRVKGSVSIPEKLLWKVIGIDEDVKNFTTELKLRQVGKNYGEGYIT